jgi:hypothetical protein
MGNDAVLTVGTRRRLVFKNGASFKERSQMKPDRAVCRFSLVSALLAPAVAMAVDVYVATDGNDAWSGRFAAPNAAKTDGPLATLQRARDELRKAPKDQGRNVIVRAGTYRLTQPFALTEEDSGSRERPAT